MASEFYPGWADKLPETVQGEQEQREEMGWKPRKVWRSNLEVSQESRLRGAHSRGKRVLPKVEFPEDE